MCVNQYCNHYGDRAYYNFCPSCFKTFDRCAGIHYVKALKRRPSPPGLKGIKSPPLDVYPPIISPISPTDPANATPFRDATEMSTRYKESIAHLENASKVGTKMCRFPKCGSYGNSRCQGYCNDCYIKLKQLGLIR